MFGHIFAIASLTFAGYRHFEPRQWPKADRDRFESSLSAPALECTTTLQPEEVLDLADNGLPGIGVTDNHKNNATSALHALSQLDPNQLQALLAQQVARRPTFTRTNQPTRGDDLSQLRNWQQAQPGFSMASTRKSTAGGAGKGKKTAAGGKKQPVKHKRRIIKAGKNGANGKKASPTKPMVEPEDAQQTQQISFVNALAFTRAVTKTNPATIRAVSDYVSFRLFRTTQFIQNSDKLADCTAKVLDGLIKKGCVTFASGEKLGTEEERARWVICYQSTVNNAIKNRKNYIADRFRDRCKALAQAKEKIPSAAAFMKFAKREVDLTNKDQKEGFKLYWTLFLLSLIGNNDWLANTHLYTTISNAPLKENDNRKLFTVSVEAFAVLVVKNCEEKWKNMADVWRNHGQLPQRNKDN